MQLFIKNCAHFLVLLCGAVLPFSQANAVVVSKGFIERTLSDYYETLSRETLEHLVKADQFKVLVDTTLDESVDLQKVQDEIAQTPLPGTVSPSWNYSDRELIGKFESLAQKRNVMLVLSPSVPEAKEAVIKEALTGKLHLNLEGKVDSLFIRKSELNIADKKVEDRAPATTEKGVSTFDISPTVLTALIFGFLSLLVALYLYMKWRSEQPEVARAEADEEGEDSSDDENENESIGETGDELTADEKPLDVLERPVETMDMFIQQISTLTQTHTGLVSQALQNLATSPEGLERIAAMMELLGVEKSLNLFNEVPQKVWSVVGRHMAQNPQSPDAGALFDQVKQLYKNIVAYIVQHKGFDRTRGVFSSFDKFAPNDIAKVLVDEPSESISLFLSGLSQNIASEVISLLPAERRPEILMGLASIEKVSLKQSQDLERHFSKKLSAGNAAEFVNVDNASKLFKSLSQMPAHEEEILFAKMLESDPGLEVRARKYRLYPIHLMSIRRDILTNEIQPLSVDDMGKVLRGLDENLIEHIMGCISEKKAEIVKDVLADLNEKNMSGEYAAYRRALLDSIHGKYIADDEHFVDSLFDSSGGKPSRSKNAA